MKLQHGVGTQLSLKLAWQLPWVTSVVLSVVLEHGWSLLLVPEEDVVDGRNLQAERVGDESLGPVAFQPEMHHLLLDVRVHS